MIRRAVTVLVHPVIVIKFFMTVAMIDLILICTGKIVRMRCGIQGVMRQRDHVRKREQGVQENEQSNQHPRQRMDDFPR